MKLPVLSASRGVPSQGNSFLRMWFLSRVGFCSLILLLPVAVAQEITASGTGDMAIIGPIEDGTPPPPAPLSAPSCFNVMATRVRQLSDHKVIMHRVADPGLPDPPASPPPMNKQAMAALRASPKWQAMIAKRGKATVIQLSATVVDHEATFLRWRYEGEEYQAWSNIDFNHFGGFGEFTKSGRRYLLFMELGNVNSEPVPMPGWPGEPPELAADGPAYILVKGDSSKPAAVEPIGALHDLYLAAGERLAAAYEGREHARAGREAFLKAHPPVPSDTVVYFWPRKISQSEVAP